MVVTNKPSEFWNNRIQATEPALEPSQTRIPLVPDQTEFLERWFEFHQGHRFARAADGTDHCIAVIGEPFRNVSPGFLPRTLDELRTGRSNDASRPENRIRRRRLTSEEERPQEEPQQSIEDALDNLLNEISDEETPLTHTAQHQLPRSHQEQHENIVQPQTQPQEATETGINAALTRAQRRARERLVRVFGSLEDVAREDYESPLSTLYNRADARYQQAEARRATGDTTAPSTEGMSARERRDIEEQILWGVMTESRSDHISTNERDDSPLRQDVGNDRIAMLRSLTAMIRLRSGEDSQPPALQQTLDDPERPPPLTEEQMTKNLACQVCYVQLANIAVVPCGHMVMCQWCADVVVPVRHNTFPARPSKCPMCRKGIKQRFKIITGS